MTNVPKVISKEEALIINDDDSFRIKTLNTWIEIKKGTSTYFIFKIMPFGIACSCLCHEDYGKEWRLWTRKSSKKQRDAVKWL